MDAQINGNQPSNQLEIAYTYTQYLEKGISGVKKVENASLINNQYGGNSQLELGENIDSIGGGVNLNDLDVNIFQD